MIGGKLSTKFTWQDIGVQLLTSAVLIILAFFSWGEGVQSNVYASRDRITGLEERIKGDENRIAADELVLRDFSNQYSRLVLKVDQAVSTLATISAQLDDLKKELRR
jgi:hypothetical protein